MEESIFSILQQVPLVAAFVWFAITSFKMMREYQSSEQSRMLSHEQSMAKAQREFMDEQNTRHTALLRELSDKHNEITGIERARRKEAMAQGLKEVNTISAAITQLANALSLQTEAFTRHDVASLEQHKIVVDELKRLSCSVQSK